MTTSIVPKNQRFEHYVKTTSGTLYRLGERKVTSARVWRGCKTDGDCAYNGKCSQSSCTCKSGWTGPACTELDLLPTLNGQDAGYNYVDPKD